MTSVKETDASLAEAFQRVPGRRRTATKAR